MKGGLSCTVITSVWDHFYCLLANYLVNHEVAVKSYNFSVFDQSFYISNNSFIMKWLQYLGVNVTQTHQGVHLENIKYFSCWFKISVFSVLNFDLNSNGPFLKSKSYPFFYCFKSKARCSVYVRVNTLENFRFPVRKLKAVSCCCSL